MDPERVRDALTEVLARPEFAELRPTWFERVGAWLGDRLDAVWDVIAGLLPGPVGAVGPGLSRVLLLLLVAVAVVVAGRFLARTRRDPRTRLAGDGRTGRAPREWLAEADAHEQAGRWRAAVRCLWRAAVADLVARGLVDEVPGRTTGEYRQAVRATHPEAAGVFSEMTSIFEEAWYGSSPVSARDVRRVRGLLGQLRPRSAAAAS